MQAAHFLGAGFCDGGGDGLLASICTLYDRTALVPRRPSDTCTIIGELDAEAPPASKTESRSATRLQDGSAV